MARLRPPSVPSTLNIHGARSAYVYVAQSPDRLDLCKVGHTTRPPHVRMRELGKTTWLTPLEVNSARFFWDALTVERQLHIHLAQFACQGTQEWFEVPANQVGGLLRDWTEVNARGTGYGLRHDHEDTGWMSMRMEWALEMIDSPAPAHRKTGWRDVEKLSALGHAPASWLLAERLLVEDGDPMRVLWVLDAAHRQGHSGALLRRDWVASMTPADPTRRRWKDRAMDFLNRQPDPSFWSSEDRETLSQEVALWRKRPSLAWLDGLPGMVEKSELIAPV